MTINGFEVDQFNVYKLEENRKSQTCPLCSHTRKKKTQKCLTVRWEVGLAVCSHCGELLQLHTYKKKNEETNYTLPKKINNTQLSDNALKWFESRGISQFVIRLMKISEGKELMPDRESDKWKEKNTIQFNYFRYSELINIKYRSGDKSFKMFKDAEKIPYNVDRIIGSEIIYCVEGEMDVLAVMECGIYNVTSPPNGFTEKGNVNLDWLNKDADSFINSEKLILAFDNDVPGENGKKEFIRRFGAHKCFVVDLKECKDSNEYLLKYGKEKLREALENHIEIPLENVSSYNSVKEKVRDFFLNGMPKGLVTDTLKTFDLNFSVNTGHVVLVTGTPSSGKSDLVDQITIGYALKYGYKTAYASPENKPNELHLQKIIRKLVGIVPKSTKDFNDSFVACENFADNNFFFIDLEYFDLEKVIMKARELVFRKGIRILVIDPFNKVRFKGKVDNITGNQINDYTNQYLSLITMLATELDILVILVAHPIKLTKMSNGKRPVPDFYDVKGGGEMYDMIHHGIVVHRDYDYKLSLIRNLKVKFAHLGENNVDSWYAYNINNGRFTEIDGDPETSSDSINILWDNSNWVTRSMNSNSEKEIIFEDYNPDKWIEDFNNTDELPF